jgi:hypothetical protein
VAGLAAKVTIPPGAKDDGEHAPPVIPDSGLHEERPSVARNA